MSTSARWLSTGLALALALVASPVAHSARAQASDPERERRSLVAPSWDVVGVSERGRSDLRGSVSERGRITWRSLLDPLPAPAVPERVTGFDAIPRIGSNWPADPSGTLGRSVFMTAVNSSFAMYTRSGVAALGPQPLSGLFPLQDGTRLEDPKVIYDQYEDRFVLAFVGVNDRLRRSWFLVVTIPDRTPGHVDTWCGSKVVADRTRGDGPQFPNALGLGYDREHIVLTSNQFDYGSNAYQGPQVVVVGKTDLYNCDRTLKATTFAGAQTRNPDGSLAFALQPAITVGSGNFAYLMSFQPGRPNSIVLWRISEAGGRPRLARTALQVRPVHIAPFATQGGGGLDIPNTWWDPGDLRITSAFADLPHRSVYGAHVIEGDPGPDAVTGNYVEAVIRWYQIRVRPRLERSSVVRAGTIGVSEVDMGWPAIGTDVDGNLFVTYSRASQPRAEFLSTWVTRVAPGATAGVSVLLAAGTARMEAMAGPERWGGPPALVRDPTDPGVIALVNQYASGDGGVTDLWQQTVHLVHEVAPAA